MFITKATSLKGTITIPGDKSISHRAIMFASLAEGMTEIAGFLPGEDCLSTIRCMRMLGVHIEIEGNSTDVRVHGKGWKGLRESIQPLDVGNSGTTIRLMSGILGSLPFFTVLTGDDSIAKRPMLRVVEPLRLMGAEISGRNDGKFTPLAISGRKLHGITYESSVSSAQVKSAVLLAGLHADGTTSFTEPSLSRDHTERMLEHFGVQLIRSGSTLQIEGGQRLNAGSIRVPGDISSAAFLIAAALITPNSVVTIKDVGINPTRFGIIDVLRRMGGTIEVTNERMWGTEPVADITAVSSELRAIEISGEIIPRIIDELPILAVVATRAKGRTVVKDAAELRVKETDRIQTMTSELQKCNAIIFENEDGFIVEGPTTLKGATVDSYGDHRIGMAMAVAGLVAEGDTVILNDQSTDISFPGFERILKSLQL